ncbi:MULTISPECIES: heptaprenyl diphosphate synthase component 1 [Neobacillus]|jgi:heptaprenyl diphosphate synthase|uniref:Heptaprenyl diphosphate synthase component 1 n=1 Tax=Neobacillus sedimentimangrovi TaxID=2699460 RepID=A0ABS8QKC5_9BACI|nr:heptaprenyl diphosphate synthase component 1 [Neobacillus sedimentimangrovi]AIM15446.1 heptaprenyl diphosphate synthase [Bacillus sp. X1(2014)]MCD4839281.1 heptaprenyl diphosphate synthase component 1 [Neobacillus sedimentimangrovi]
MQDIRHKYLSIKEKVEKSVFDTYLLKYIKAPIIDDEKLLILISIMDQLDLSDNELETYVLSTMLVQIALDTHEYISTAKDEKIRQLTVLAGDYFSGLYYKLLAESEDHLVIRALSRGIKEVNEHKIAVYHKETTEIQKLMQSMMMIESSLLLRLFEYFKLDLWNELVSHLLLFKRLLNEKNEFIQKGRSFLFDALKQTVFPVTKYKMMDMSIEQKNKLIMVCDNYLELSKRNIEKGLQQFPYLNHVLESKIFTLLNQYQPYAKTFVEEG